MHFVEAPNNFYLGAKVDPESGNILEDTPVYYEARDLTTHAILLGMTGSGKTGLGITLLEEAALDNIPSIVIDLKGDISNLALAFPDLRPEEVQPWVNPEDATRADHSLEEHAVQVSEQWRKGLTEWGIDRERLRKYREAANITIYTPGSEAGMPISILQSFSAPREGWLNNEERLREHIVGIVTALLKLVGIEAQPLKDKEHLLLTNIFEYNWRNNVDLTLKDLIVQVQKPPFAQMGVFDVDTVFSQKDRFKLAQQLNNIIAAPGFQTWINGDPLHIPSLLFTQDGKPRTSVFYLAHLNDAERQFIVTLLAQSMIAWMRSLSGSTGLRAMLYIDEMFGMFPPHPYNPPTKEPILRLLKQARAFGIGLVLATQNPTDLDYKGLSNAGTWFIGKMQTDNDRKRVVEGLSSAQDATSSLDVSQVDQLVRTLKQRQFIMHNIHEDETPILMETRWAMSYLRGPLTRSQIETLMTDQRAQQPAPSARPSYLARQSHAAIQSYDTQTQPDPDAAQPSSSEPSYFQPAQSAPAQPQSQQNQLQVVEEPAADVSAVPLGFLPSPPQVPNNIQQFYLPVEFSVEDSIGQWERQSGFSAANVETQKRLLYRPSLLAEVQVRYLHNKTNTHQLLWYAFVVPNLPTVPYVEWQRYQTEPFDPRALQINPFSRAYYGDVPSTLRAAPAFKELQNSLQDWMTHNAVMSIYHNPTLKLHSGLDEDRREFLARVAAAAREAREAEIETVAAKYGKELEKLEGKARVKAMKLDSQRGKAEARKREELLTGAESVWRLMKGNAYRTISRAGELRREVTSDQDRADILEEELMDLADKLESTEDELEAALYEIQERWAKQAREIEEIPIRAMKKDISFIVFGIGWVPYWDVAINGSLTVLPASSSGLSQAQGSLPAGNIP